MPAGYIWQLSLLSARRGIFHDMKWKQVPSPALPQWSDKAFTSVSFKTTVCAISGGLFYFGLINKDENKCPWLSCCLKNTPQVQRPDGSAEPIVSLGRGSNSKSRVLIWSAWFTLQLWSQWHKTESSAESWNWYTQQTRCPVCVCVTGWILPR